MDLTEMFLLGAGSHSLKHFWFESCLACPDRCQDLSMAIHKTSDVFFWGLLQMPISYQHEKKSRHYYYYCYYCYYYVTCVWMYYPDSRVPKSCGNLGGNLAQFIAN